MLADSVNPDGTRNGRPVTSPLPPEVDSPTAPPVFHVWVNLGTQASNDAHEYPGLVLAWRQGISYWEALVTYVVPNGSRGTVISTWVEARCLKPVRSR